MNFGDLLSRAWRIVWRNKWMFILGFLAALGSGGGNSGSGFNIGSGDVDLPPGLVQEMARFWEQFAVLILALICLSLIVGVVFWLVRLTTQAGLISAATRLDAGEQLSFGDAVGAGLSFLGRMVGLNLLMFGPFFLLALVGAGVFLGMFGATLAAALSDSSPNVDAILGVAGVAVFCLGLLGCLLVPIYLSGNGCLPLCPARRGVKQ